MSVANVKPLIPGQTWLTGVGAPNPQFGYKTQFYLDSATGTIYRKTDTLIWSVAGTMNPSGDAPVKSVNGEIGDVVLDAADVGAIPTSQKGAPDGVASLDATGKVPTAQLPPPPNIPVTSVNNETGAVVLDAADVGAIPTSEKGVANGVASLDATGKVPTSQLPASTAPVLSVNGLIGNVELTAAIVGAVPTAGGTMTGILTMGPISATPGETGQIAFQELAANGVNSVTLRAPDALSQYVVLTLPTSHGTSGQVLTTDGTGILSWTSPGGAVAGTLSHPNVGTTYELNKNSGSVGRYTTAIGVDAGIFSSGQNNAMYGYGSGRSLSTGTQNTFVGSQAAYNSTTLSSSVALGYSALLATTGGSNNVAIGSLSGRYLTSGQFNIFINTWGSSTNFSADGCCIIGMDSTGSQAIIPSVADTNNNNWFVLGTQYHKYYLEGVVKSNLTLGPTGTSSGQTGTIRFRELSTNGTNYVSFRAPDQINSDVTWTLPSSDGSNGSVLTTNGSGVLSWVSSGGSVAGTLSHPTTGSTFELNKNNPSMSGTYNTVIGVNAGTLITSGSSNTLIGAQAGYSITNGYQNIFLGVSAGYSWQSSVSNIIIGNGAAGSVTNGAQNVIIGDNALISSSGSGVSSSVSLGYYSLANLNNGQRNLSLGSYSGGSLIEGNYNTIINSEGSNQQNSVFSGCVVIGKDNTGESATFYPQDNVFVLGTSRHEYRIPGRINSVLSLNNLNDVGEIRLNGYYTGSQNYVGFKAPYSISNSVVWTLPPTDGTNGQILTTNGSGVLTWSSPGGNVPGTLSHPTSGSTFELGTNNVNINGTSNTCIGVYSGISITSGNNNTILGSSSGLYLTSGSDNCLIGSRAGLNASGERNVVIGSQAGESIKDGEENTFIGKDSGKTLGTNRFSNRLSLSWNTVIGCRSLSFAVTGTYNLALGIDSGNCLIGGNYNTFINTPGGSAASGSYEGVVAIGKDSLNGYAVVNDNNQFVLGTSNHKYIMPGKIYSPLTLASPLFGGQIVFTDFNSANTITLKAPNSIGSNAIYVLPSTDGAAGQSLKTDGAGNLYWG